ncbi:MAG: Ldh family oxidoreductase, partial [Candidatus Latescibacterota bacterium]|nr:Ldh family oxidoreductase [Candidatus Latescibacterota bacterium]
MPRFTKDQLTSACTTIFTAAGTPAPEARIVAELLTEANCAGHHSHGLIRIPQYLETIERGELVPAAVVELVRETSITAVV